MVSVLRPGQRILNIPGIGVQMSRRAVSAGGAASLGWWDGSGTIAADDVLEHVELPTIGQLYAGAAVASGQPWSIAMRGIAPADDSSGKYLLDSQTSRTVIGVSPPNNGFYAGSWSNINLFPDTTTDYVWFLVSSGTSIQAYRNNTAIGAAQASTNGLANSGATRWKRDYTGTGNAKWNNAVPCAAVYKIALGATQRAALYTSMAAL